MNKDAVAEMSQQNQVEEAEKLVPEGYKQTEVGVIPEDWSCINISEVCSSIGDGIHATPIYSDNGPVFFVNGNNLSFGKIVISSETKRTSLSELSKHSRPLTNRSILISINGTIGNLAFYNGENIVLGKSAAYLNIKQELVKEFVYYCLSSNKIIQAFHDGLTGSTIKNLGLGVIRKTCIPLPSPEEQATIANALSDTDALLSELEKLIAKKQAIKTATMQQLLTGRTRLPQFAHHPDGSKKGYKQSELGEIPEDWEAKNFGDLLEPSITRKKTNPSEMISFVGMQDVSESAQLVNQSQIQYSTIRSGFTYFEKDDVLVAKITPCFENGKGCHAVNLKTDIGFGSTEFHVLRATNLSDSRFIYFWTTRESFRAELETEMVGSAGHRRVPLAALQNYLIPCPSDKQEQTAIATILSDMDEEIQALEHRLNKTRQIKQGMMQELLTGKTRLIVGGKNV